MPAWLARDLYIGRLPPLYLFCSLLVIAIEHLELFGAARLWHSFASFPLIFRIQ